MRFRLGIALGFVAIALFVVSMVSLFVTLLLSGLMSLYWWLIFIPLILILKLVIRFYFTMAYARNDLRAHTKFGVSEEDYLDLIQRAQSYGVFSEERAAQFVRESIYVFKGDVEEIRMDIYHICTSLRNIAEATTEDKDEAILAEFKRLTNRRYL